MKKTGWQVGCYERGRWAGCGTSSWDRTGMDLAVVAPTRPHRAAALLLAGVTRQDVVAEVCVVQVIVALFPLLNRRGCGASWSSRFGVGITCGHAGRSGLLMFVGSETALQIKV